MLFRSALSGEANAQAVTFARQLAALSIAGVREVVPSLVSVLLTYDPHVISPAELAGEVRLAFAGRPRRDERVRRNWTVSVRFGGVDGPDLGEVADLTGLTPDEFVSQHNISPLTVLATGFAPGFVYCGFHRGVMVVPRRSSVRPAVGPGTVLFAAGQTAIAASTIPTGWHVIGQTDFRNFDAEASPPTLLTAGDRIEFEAVG